MLISWSRTPLARLLAAGAGLAAVLAMVQSSAGAATSVRIDGVVRSVEAGQPGLGGIEVCARGKATSGRPLTLCAKTASDGRYSLTAPKGSYHFFATEPDLYGEWVSQSYDSGRTTTLRSARTINFQLARGAQISGVLRMPDGSTPGASNALVVSAYRVSSDGSAGQHLGLFANTNDAGYFQISKLPAGRYAIQVEDNGHEPRLARQWYPSATTAKAGTALTVVAGQRLTDRDMTLRAGSTLRFTIKNPRGKITGGDVRLYDRDGRAVQGSALERNGLISFSGLAPGAYRARGSSHDVAYWEWYSDKPSLAKANPINLGPGTTVSRDFTVSYPTLKAVKRPRVKIDANTVVSKPAKWKKKARTYDVLWYRDGKLTKAPDFDWYLVRKADVGHRIKACYLARRTGYAEGRSCSKYSKKISQY